MSVKSIKILSVVILGSLATGLSVYAQETGTTPVSSTSAALVASHTASSPVPSGSVPAASSSLSSSVPASSPARPTPSTSTGQTITLTLQKPELKDQTALIQGQFSQALAQDQALKAQVFQGATKLAAFSVTQTAKSGQAQIKFPALKLQGLSAGTYHVKVLNGQDQVLGQVDLVLPGSVQALESRTSQVSEVSSSTASSAPSSSQLDSKLSIRLTSPEIKVKNLVLKGQLEQPLTAPTSLILTILDAKGQATGLSQTLDLAKDAKAFVFSELALDGLAEGDYQLQVTDSTGQVLAKEKLTNLSTQVSSSAPTPSRPAASSQSSRSSASSSLKSEGPASEETLPDLSSDLDSSEADLDSVSAGDLTHADDGEAADTDMADQEDQAERKSHSGYAVVRPNGQVVYRKGATAYTAANAGKKVIVRPQATTTRTYSRLPRTGEVKAYGMTLLGFLLAVSVWLGKYAYFKALVKQENH